MRLHALNLLTLLLTHHHLTTANTITFTTTLPPLPSPTSPSYTNPSLLAPSILNSTNYYRSLHSAAPLTWNTSLASYAHAYASHCQFQHSGGPYGENLAAGYPSVALSVDGWGNEGDGFDYGAESGNGGFSEQTGHFTQLVWRATSSTGCGVAECNGENGTPGWYLVCEYWPRGNVIGEFSENVLQGNGSAAGSGNGNEVKSQAPGGEEGRRVGWWWVGVEMVMGVGMVGVGVCGL